ncbi:MAG: hypothetical protein ABIB79_01020 [archaeon]
MVYKRYIKRDGKVFGPYYYESYRDRAGKVKSKFISGPEVYAPKGSVTRKNKFNWVLMAILFGVLGIVIIGALFFSMDQGRQEVLVGEAHDISSIIGALGGEVYSFVTGFVAEGEESSDDGGSGGDGREEEPSGEIDGGGEGNNEISTGGDGAIEDGEVVDEEEVEDVESEKVGEESNGGEEEVEDVESESNESVSNETIVVDVNETLVGGNEIVIDEVNESIIGESNEKMVETSPSLGIMNSRIVVGRPVKWVRVVQIDELGEFIIEIPKESVDISIRTGAEIQEALDEIKEYGEVIENAGRDELVSEVISGNVIRDVGRSKGIFVRVLGWFRSLTITGNVISGDELEGRIVEGVDSKSIDLSRLVDVGAEVAIEYYTEAPSLDEEEIENGKKVIISGPDELEYIDVLAYVEVDGVLPVGEEENIRVYWEEEKKFVEFSSSDLNDNGMIDYVEWVVPHLSEQTFDISLSYSNAPPSTEITVFSNGLKEITIGGEI